MEELPPRVQLVEFPDGTAPGALRSCLEDCGIDVAARAGGPWLDDASGSPWPSLLWLGQGDPQSTSRLCRDILSRPRRATIAVFEQGLDHRDCEVCTACSDFMSWPASAQELILRLQRVWVSPAPPGQADRVPMIGASRPMQQVRQTIARLAACEAPVLVTGETGTGKELVARAVHYMSARHDGPFIPVNCGAIPPELIENELFGHRAGAYTSAGGAQTGLVEQARGGSLFLDEIGTLDHRAQCALLRFLQDLEYRSLGGGQTRQADVRVIAATNADLASLCELGRFRSDLYFRLDILRVDIPALRQRLDDIPELTEHFLARFGHEYSQPARRLTDDALRWLQGQDWPGNIRQLENGLRRAFLLSEGTTIGIGGLQPGAETTLTEDASTDDFRSAKAESIARFERRYLSMLMRRTGGNVTQAARLAGKERRALGKLLKKHGLSAADYR